MAKTIITFSKDLSEYSVKSHTDEEIKKQIALYIAQNVTDGAVMMGSDNSERTTVTRTWDSVESAMAWVQWITAHLSKNPDLVGKFSVEIEP